MSLGTLLLVSSCTWRGTPVPVRGELSALAGEWEGSYSSDETGRSGSIAFKLVAGTDSAFGDVVMTPAADQQVQSGVSGQPRTAPVGVPKVLRITFVRSDKGKVSGRLDPYDDPVTHASLLTTFAGTVSAKEVKGSYTTRVGGSDRIQNGVWQVKRVGG